MSDEKQTIQASFVPFVGLETLDGQIVFRRWDLIRGMTTREGLTPNDGCMVHLAGEPAIACKTSPVMIASQVRGCEHWSKVREVAESVAAQQAMQRNGSNILRPIG